MGDIEYFKLVIHKSAHCLWAEDVKEKSLDYLNRIDPRYFEFLATTQIQMLEGDNQQYAAMALRTTYGHALETLFALLCATVQAPKCLWLGSEVQEQGAVRFGQRYYIWRAFSLSLEAEA
jgi:hypothetical protein